MKSKALCISLLLLSIGPLFGYALEGESLTLDRTVVMQLSFGKPGILQDGSPSFTQVALGSSRRGWADGGRDHELKGQ
jgi:hypothetical protein